MLRLAPVNKVLRLKRPPSIETKENTGTPLLIRKYTMVVRIGRGREGEGGPLLTGGGGYIKDPN